MSSFDDDDDDLTDIRQLPDLNEEQEESFESLDDIADSLGFGPSSDEEEEEDEPVSLDDMSELPDSPPDFNFEDAEDTDFGEESSDDEQDVSEEEFNFDSDENSDEEESDFNFDEDESTDASTDFETSEEESGPAAEESDYTPKSDFTLEEDLTPEPPVSNLSETKTPISQVVKKESTHSTPPENFEEVKNFARDMSSKNFSSEGNPPFSIILKGIKYIEDAESIAEILIKYKLYQESDMENIVSELSKGTYLIPRLSEYAAIILCHQMRSYDLEILMGLTEEITPPKSYTSNDRGPTSKRTILANRKHHLNLKNKNQDNEILTTTLPHFQDCNIVKYMGVASESRVIDSDLLKNSERLEQEILEEVPEKSKKELNLLKLKKENRDAADSKFGFDFEEIYNSKSHTANNSGLEYIYADLITNLKLQARSAGANAIVGITFSTSPITIEKYLSQGPKYQILCTGNIVWIEKK